VKERKRDMILSKALMTLVFLNRIIHFSHLVEQLPAGLVSHLTKFPRIKGRSVSMIKTDRHNTF
jgi:hypothetical protein